MVTKYGEFSILFDIEHAEYPIGYLSILDILCIDIRGITWFWIADFQKKLPSWVLRENIVQFYVTKFANTSFML